VQLRVSLYVRFLATANSFNLVLPSNTERVPSRIDNGEDSSKGADTAQTGARYTTYLPPFTIGLRCTGYCAVYTW
jgi:hypothetical protein